MAAAAVAREVCAQLKAAGKRTRDQLGRAPPRLWRGALKALPDLDEPTEPAALLAAAVRGSADLDKVFEARGDELVDAGFAALRELAVCETLLSRTVYDTQSRAVTEGVEVVARALHTSNVPRFVFVKAERDFSPVLAQVPYEVRITNHRSTRVQLLERRWEITNLTAEEPTIVEGAGVVGKVPVIEPGATHEYFSSCPCRSLTVMRGRFRLQDLDSGDFFVAHIDPFAVWTMPVKVAVAAGEDTSDKD